MTVKTGWLPVGFAETIKKNRIDREELLAACRIARKIAYKHNQRGIGSILDKAIKKAERKTL